MVHPELIPYLWTPPFPMHPQSTNFGKFCKLIPFLLLLCFAADVQLSAAPADLTSPAVALQNLQTQLIVDFGLKPKPRALGERRQAVPR
jgi:hypothetical protein